MLPSPRLRLAVWYALLVAALVLAAAGRQARAAGDQPVVRVATLAAEINPVTAHWLVDQIHAAADAHAAALVIELDTPGGLSTSMDDIVRAELAARIPVVVYVSPAGARAASAGFFILQGADVAAMNPLSNTGSATPIDQSGSNLGSDLRNKAIDDAVANIRGLAGEHGRNADAAARAVLPRNAKTCPDCPENWTARDALRRNVVDVLAPTLPTLLAKVDGRTLAFKHLTLHTAGARVERAGLPLQDRLLEILIDPNLIILLFLGGLAGIAFELTHPGIVLPGLLGGVSLILALLGLSIVPFSWAGIALLVGGIVLLGLEAHVPAHGAFAGVGVLGLALGGIMLFRVDGSPYGSASVPLVIAIALLLAALVLLVVQKAIAARQRPVTTGASGLLGEIAVVRTPLAPRGHVFVHGELWAAVAEPPFRPGPGERVRVLGVDGLVLRVGPAGAADADAAPAAEPGRPLLGAPSNGHVEEPVPPLRQEA